MTLRMAFVAGFLTCLLLTWLLGKRREAAQPETADRDLLDYAGMDERAKQSDRKHRLERKHYD
jgi:hypothetical protein